MSSNSFCHRIISPGTSRIIQVFNPSELFFCGFCSTEIETGDIDIVMVVESCSSVTDKSNVTCLHGKCTEGWKNSMLHMILNRLAKYIKSAETCKNILFRLSDIYSQFNNYVYSGDLKFTQTSLDSWKIYQDEEKKDQSHVISCHCIGALRSNSFLRDDELLINYITDVKELNLLDVNWLCLSLIFDLGEDVYELEWKNELIAFVEDADIEKIKNIKNLVHLSLVWKNKTEKMSRSHTFYLALCVKNKLNEEDKKEITESVHDIFSSMKLPSSTCKFSTVNGDHFSCSSVVTVGKGTAEIGETYMCNTRNINSDKIEDSVYLMPSQSETDGPYLSTGKKGSIKDQGKDILIPSSFTSRKLVSSVFLNQCLELHGLELVETSHHLIYPNTKESSSKQTGIQPGSSSSISSPCSPSGLASSLLGVSYAKSRRHTAKTGLY